MSNRFRLLFTVEQKLVVLASDLFKTKKHLDLSSELRKIEIEINVSYSQ